jgi:hypothetical protein
MNVDVAASVVLTRTLVARNLIVPITWHIPVRGSHSPEGLAREVGVFEEFDMASRVDLVARNMVVSNSHLIDVFIASYRSFRSPVIGVDVYAPARGKFTTWHSASCRRLLIAVNAGAVREANLLFVRQWVAFSPVGASPAPIS